MSSLSWCKGLPWIPEVEYHDMYCNFAISLQSNVQMVHIHIDVWKHLLFHCFASQTLFTFASSFLLTCSLFSFSCALSNHCPREVVYSQFPSVSGEFDLKAYILEGSTLASIKSGYLCPASHDLFAWGACHACKHTIFICLFTKGLIDMLSEI